MNLIARITVLTLVATGAVASSQIANAAQPTTSARVSALPVPVCPPGDPKGCGIGGPGTFTQQ